MTDDHTTGATEPGVHVTKRPTMRKRAKKNIEEHVTKNMTVSQIIALYPQATEIMAEYGLHCFGCSANDMESLEEGCIGHGFTEDDVDNLVYDINEVIALTPPRPQTLEITKEAAHAIGEIAKAEGKEGNGLCVMADKTGAFFLEFQEEPDRGDKTFQNDDAPEIKIFASTLTLQRVGGSVIDFRDGRFKLDLPQDGNGCACKNGGSCGCK